MATSSIESVEYKAIAGCFDKLVIAFRASHLTIANELVAKELIPSDVHNEVLTAGVDDEKKATMIVKSALDQIRVCPEKYSVFMALPSFEDPCFRSLHEEISVVHESLSKAKILKRTPPKAISTQTTADRLGTGEPQTCSQEIQSDVKNGTKKAEDVFCCPCGQCSLDQYLDEGCLKSTSQQFPYLDIHGLDEDDKEDLTQKLLQDITDMIKSFAQLTNATRNSLHKRGVSVRDLVAHTLSLGAYYDSQAMQKPLLNEDTETLKEAETVHDVFITLQPHMSFFNHELLKHITESEELCTDDNRKQMDEYCTKFNEFCRRKIFEVPPGTFGQSTVTARKSKRKVFAVLITKQEEGQNLAFINKAKHKIASILKLRSSTLHLHRIDKGSIILVFSVPEFVAEEIFPLAPSMDVELESEGLQILAPLNTKDHAESPTVCTKSRRFSWPLESKKGCKITTNFSHCSLVKDDSRFLYSAKKGHVQTIETLIRTNSPASLVEENVHVILSSKEEEIEQLRQQLLQEREHKDQLREQLQRKEEEYAGVVQAKEQLQQERDQAREQLQRKEEEVVQVNEQLQQERDQVSRRSEERERQLGQVNQQLQEAEQTVAQFKERVAELEQLLSQKNKKKRPETSSRGEGPASSKLKWWQARQVSEKKMGDNLWKVARKAGGPLALKKDTDCDLIDGIVDEAIDISQDIASVPSPPPISTTIKDRLRQMMLRQRSREYDLESGQEKILSGGSRAITKFAANTLYTGLTDPHHGHMFKEIVQKLMEVANESNLQENVESISSPGIPLHDSETIILCEPETTTMTVMVHKEDLDCMDDAELESGGWTSPGERFIESL